MDKDKKIKQLEELVKELQEENDLLWNYLDEIRESEKALMNEIQLAVDHYVTKQMKPIGDAQTIYLYGRGKYVLSKKEFVAVGDAVFLKKRKKSYRKIKIRIIIWRNIKNSIKKNCCNSKRCILKWKI